MQCHFNLTNTNPNSIWISGKQKGEKKSLEYSKGSFLLLNQYDMSLRQMNDY